MGRNKLFRRYVIDEGNTALYEGGRNGIGEMGIYAGKCGSIYHGG